MIVSFIGDIGSGKTSAADHLVEHHGFTKHSFADPLRRVLEKLNPLVDPYSALRYRRAVQEVGYVEAKKEFPEIRWLLQVLGTDVGRNMIHPDLWVDMWYDSLPDGDVVIDDMRFPNEYDAVPDAYIVRINRLPGRLSPAKDVHVHESERHWPRWNPHYRVYAETLSELYTGIDLVIEDMG